MGFENPGRPWPGEREGPAATRWEGFSFQTPFPVHVYGNKGFIISVSWSFSRRKPSWPNFEVIS